MKNSKAIHSLKKFSKILFVISFFSIINTEARAQSLDREMGIRFTGLDNYNFVYKKGLAENKYRRFTLGMFNLGVMGATGSAKTTSLGLAFELGMEYRKLIAQNLKFIYGPDFNYNIRVTATSGSSTPQMGVGIGCILGFQYDFSEKFYMNIEAIPAISGSFLKDNSGVSYQFNSGFTSNTLAISLVYKFKKESAKAETK